jgi:hypothetical protein
MCVYNIHFEFPYTHRHTHTHTRTFMLIGLCFVINYEKLLDTYLQLNTKLKHKELCELLTQSRGEHSNLNSEYVRNSVIGMFRYICFN